MKPWIYFADLTHTGRGINARTFPLGAGSVAAYATREIGDKFQFKILKLPEQLDDSLREHMPRVMCFSHYVWNARLTDEFARLVKRRDPNTIVIFGGPNFPVDRAERAAYLRANPHIDFYIKWDGEYAFVELMKSLMGTGLDPDAFRQAQTMIPNCCYVVGPDYVEGLDQRVTDLDELPSPYLLGLFDDFFDLGLDVLFETTRGCPYSCTFCNDGHRVRSKVFRKSPDSIRDEFEYIVKRVQRSSELHLADLNFGMYREDIETSRILRDLIDRHGWPKRIITSVGKSQPARILEAADIINRENDGIFKFGASFQSTDPAVLDNIARKNVPFEKLVDLRNFKSGRFANLEFFTELIVPLPGDTRETHFESLRACIDDLGMNNIDVHQLTLLPGTSMADAPSRERYGFDTRHRVYVGCFGIYRIGDREIPCAEIEEIVVATDKMPFDDFLECRIMDFLVKVYIDHELFSEIFGLVRWLGLSEFGLLVELKENHIRPHPKLAALIEAFVSDTKSSLYEDLTELKNRIEQRAIIEQYIKRALGNNEILSNRSLAYLECNTELYLALKNAAIAYLEKHGALTAIMRDYIDQALRFSNLRKFDPRDIDTARRGNFDFDFISAADHGFVVDPEKIHIDPVEIVFRHDDENLALIESTLEKWSDENGLNHGKLFQKGNLKAMRRSAQVAT